MCEEGDKRGGLRGPREQHPLGHGMARGVWGKVGKDRSRIQGPGEEESFTEETGMQCLISQPGAVGEGWKSSLWGWELVVSGEVRTTEA